MNKENNLREYDKHTSAVFCKTTEAFGGLSNMASGYPLIVNGEKIRNTEALYQACRFPNYPEIQYAIIHEASPMAAKMISRQNIHRSRPDWDKVRFKIMYWCITVKLLQNWEKFSNLLLSTETKDIVELSMKDDIWGAMPQPNGKLKGVNALGRLLMQLRAEYILNASAKQILPPLEIEDFKLFGKDVETICRIETIPKTLF